MRRSRTVNSSRIDALKVLIASLGSRTDRLQPRILRDRDTYRQHARTKSSKRTLSAYGDSSAAADAALSWCGEPPSLFHEAGRGQPEHASDSVDRRSAAKVGLVDGAMTDSAREGPIGSRRQQAAAATLTSGTAEPAASPAESLAGRGDRRAHDHPPGRRAGPNLDGHVNLGGLHVGREISRKAAMDLQPEAVLDERPRKAEHVSRFYRESCALPDRRAGSEGSSRKRDGSPSAHSCGIGL
jgi:hypothetical protein